MPDKWAQYAVSDSPAAPPPDKWSQYAVRANAPSSQPPPDVVSPPPARSWLDEVGDYFGGAGKEAAETAKGLVPGLLQATNHPLDTIRSIGAQQGELLDKAHAAFKSGDYPTGVRHSIEYLLPVLGPKLSALGDEAGSGQPGALSDALGRTTTFGLAQVAPAVVPRVTGALKAAGSGAVRRMIPNVNNPTEEAALASVEPSVDMSVGQRTGQSGLQRVESGLENFPGSANRSQQFYEKQADQLATTGRKIAASGGGQQTNAVGAGQAVGERLTQRIARLKSQANRFYDDVKGAAAANQKTVQTGSTASPILGPNGQAISTPTYQTLETPVEMTPYRAALRPVYEDLMRAMPEARRAASPAFQALRNLVEDQSPYMNAMDFDKSLGAIKAIARNGENPYLTSQSQGVAKQMVAQGEKQLQDALQTAGPNVVSKLRSARNMVRSYYDTGELLAGLHDEPAALYQNLVNGGDRSFKTLTTLQQLAPHELRTVGRTFLEGLMDKATKEGGFSRAPGIYADWNRLGPEAKGLMFGPQLTGDVDNFLLAAKRLTQPQNASGSAHMVAALHGLGAVGTAIGALVSGNIPVAAGAIGEAFVVPAIAARFLFDSGNARLLTQALNTAPGTPAFSKLATVLNANLLKANKEATDSNDPTKTYVAGHIYGGLKFNGGDPKNEQNWQPAQ